MVHLPQDLILGHEGIIFLTLGNLYLFYGPHLPSGLALGPINLRECSPSNQLKQFVVSIDWRSVGLDHVLIEKGFIRNGDLSFNAADSHLVSWASKNRKYMPEIIEN